MSPKTTKRPDQPDRPDQLGDLLTRGLERDLATPVDTLRLLDRAQRGATRLRRRRTMIGAAAAVLVVTAAPLGLLRLAGLLDDGRASSPLAELGSTPTAGLALPPAPEAFTGELGDLTAGDVGSQPRVDIPPAALVTPDDIGAGDLLPRAGAPVPGQQGVWDTADQACLEQFGGLQWNLGSVTREYDDPAAGSSPGWDLKVVTRALTVYGASKQLDWLASHLDSCTSTVSDQVGWTLRSGVTVGDGSVLATTVDGGSVIAVGAVRVGAATAGFWLRVPAEAGQSLSSRKQVASQYGRSLLQKSVQRLAGADISGRAIASLGVALNAPPRRVPETGA